ncbi:MAG: hypothetical protein LBB13_01935, partial [Rickettsiales bacterium]|nr:hypothetical protein [Rickettsiales bacterium]
MKILEKNKSDVRWLSLHLRLCLMVFTVFSTVAMAGAEPAEVSSFEELKGAISDGKTEIAVKNAINFTADGPVINYDNIVISGLGENAPVLLNGNDNYKFFISGENAKNISLKNLHLDNGSSGVGSGYENGGGAIHLNAGVVVSLEGLTFSNSQTRSQGGAIYSWGTDNNNRNSLNFTGKTIFDGNKTIDIISNGGGAIYAYFSTLTFGGGPTTFKNNKSAGNGGAIYGGDGTKLTFGGDVTFTGNSSANYGGAIFSLGKNATKNILEFEGNANFVGNSTTGNVIGDGGAIYIWYSSLTFGKLLATFKNNRARCGGAIFVSSSASIEFNNGLLLIENTTEEVDSGAIDMNGSKNRLATITIVQKNPLVPTEFRGNTSGDGGHNAVFMQQYSQLNLTAHNGSSINISDVFTGDKTKDTNIITINRGDGWINI